MYLNYAPQPLLKIIKIFAKLASPVLRFFVPNFVSKLASPVLRIFAPNFTMMVFHYLLQETVQIVIKMGLQGDKAWSKITEIAATTHGGKCIVDYKTVDCRRIHTQY